MVARSLLSQDEPTWSLPQPRPAATSAVLALHWLCPCPTPVVWSTPRWLALQGCPVGLVGRIDFNAYGAAVLRSETCKIRGNLVSVTVLSPVMRKLIRAFLRTHSQCPPKSFRTCQCLRAAAALLSWLSEAITLSLSSTPWSLHPHSHHYHFYEPPLIPAYSHRSHTRYRCLCRCRSAAGGCPRHKQHR